MPNITIDGLKLENLEVKRILIKEITDTIEKAYKPPREHIVVVIKKKLPENVGIGGILLSDRRRT